MFERRTLLVCLLGLNIGIVLWQMTVDKSANLEETQHYSYAEQQSVQLAATHRPPVVAKNTTQMSPAELSLKIATDQITAEKDVSTLALQDSAQLIDLHDFKYLLPLPECAAHVEALILVHSAPRNQQKRLLIRQTWGGATLTHTSLRLMFLLGAVDAAELQLDLEREYVQHGDLMQGSFVDHYRNMTYKHVMAFKWFLSECAHAQLLIKTDDDVFLNTPQLLRYLQKSQQNETSLSSAESGKQLHFGAAQSLFHQPSNLLFCERQAHARVKRSYRSKWRVSFAEYAPRYYPPYCPGYAIIYSADVVARLYVAAQAHKYFWIDDVHVTGSLAQSSHINITNSAAYVLSHDKCEQLLKGDSRLSDVEFLFAGHLITPQQVRALWQLHLNSSRTSAHLVEPFAIETTR